MTPTQRALRILTFRFDERDIERLGRIDLFFGLAFTWLVGIGRYWDNPRVPVSQRLGLGSIAYVFLLSVFLFLLLWPLRPSRWRYSRVLIFLTLVSPPALLYAIPVEQFVSLDTATSINFWFLAIVALWRVLLLVSFLHRYADLSGIRLLVAVLFPLCAIVVTLTGLNLERAVFEFMSGNIHRVHTSADSAYAVLFLISLLSAYVVPPVFVTYIVLTILALRKKRSAKAA